MFTVTKTDEFDAWLRALKDRTGRAKILQRIERLELGNPGNVRAVGEGVSEMKIDFGPGYRVYFKQTDKSVVLILCGGDKDSQERDIKRAKQLASE